jgi:predicted nucleic acid-binding protein
MLIFDSSTLILLAKSELLDAFLGSISLKAAIPEEVARECCKAKKTIDSMLIQRAIDEARIEVTPVKNRKLITRLVIDFSLGQGEAEAIGLAITVKAKLLAIDDKNGINASRFLGVPFITAVNVLVGCREREVLSRAEAFSRLESLARYGRYKKAILDDVRARLELQK